MADNKSILEKLNGNLVPLLVAIIAIISTWAWINFSVAEMRADLSQEIIDRKEADEKIVEQFNQQYLRYEKSTELLRSELKEEFKFMNEGVQKIQEDLTEHIRSSNYHIRD